MSKKRKYCGPQEKVSILHRHLIDQVAVSDLCDEYGIHPTVFFEHGVATFQSQKASLEKQLEKRIASLAAKLNQKNEVSAEVMEENFRLKKRLGEV